MDVNYKVVCPVCKGSLIYRRLVCEVDGESHNWVWHESDCECTQTVEAGYSVVGFIDISDLIDTVADILNKVNDIKEKVDEL